MKCQVAALVVCLVMLAHLQQEAAGSSVYVRLSKHFPLLCRFPTIAHYDLDNDDRVSWDEFFDVLDDWFDEDDWDDIWELFDWADLDDDLFLDDSEFDEAPWFQNS